MRGKLNERSNICYNPSSIHNPSILYLEFRMWTLVHNNLRKQSKALLAWNHWKYLFSNTYSEHKSRRMNFPLVVSSRASEFWAHVQKIITADTNNIIYNKRFRLNSHSDRLVFLWTRKETNDGSALRKRGEIPSLDQEINRFVYYLEQLHLPTIRGKLQLSIKDSENRVLRFLTSFP